MFLNAVHIHLRNHIGLDACVGARDVGLDGISASLLCFLGDEGVLVSLMKLSTL